MAHPMGESKRDGLWVDFDRRLKLEFHGSKITSDGGLLAYRELDDALGLTEVAGTIFQDSRTGKNGWHGMTGQFRQSMFGRLGGYEDVNDADRLGRDPAMRWIVGGKAVERQAASTSQMGRFETELLATDANIEVLAGMNGAWVDKVHDRHPPKMIILDMDSSVSPTHGEQEGTAYNVHFGCTCYHPLFLFNQFGDLERCSLRPGNVHSADGWREVLEPVVERYRERNLRRYFRGDAAFAAPDIYEFLESEGFLYAIRLPKNQILQESIAHMLTRPVGRTMCGAITPASGIRLEVGTGSGAWWPRWNGTPASCAPASALLSPTCRGPPNGWWRFIITVGQRSNTSRKANTPSSGPGCHAASSATTRFGSSFTPWLTIWATSCGRLHCQRRWNTGR